MEAAELEFTIAALLALERDLLLDERVRHRDLVLVQRVGQRTVALGRAADDRQRPAVAGPVAEVLEGPVDAVVLGGVDADCLPPERLEHRFEVRHGEHHAVGQVELPVIVIDHHAQVVEVGLAGVHHAFPDRAFLELTVAAHAVAVVGRGLAAGERQALRDREPLPHWPRRQVDAREHGPGVSVQDAVMGAGVAEDRAVEVAEVGVDGSQRRHGVAFAQDEEILAALRGIDDVDVDEAAVVQGDQWDRRREGAAGVQALVHGIAALFEGRHPNIGVLDGQQPENALAAQVVVIGRGMTDTATRLEFRRT